MSTNLESENITIKRERRWMNDSGSKDIPSRYQREE